MDKVERIFEEATASLNITQRKALIQKLQASLHGKKLTADSKAYQRHRYLRKRREEGKISPEQLAELEELEKDF